MTKKGKPDTNIFQRGESAETLRKNAESVQREFSEPDRGPIKTTSFRLPQSLLTRARQAVVEQKDKGGDYQTLGALVEHGIELALAEINGE